MKLRIKLGDATHRITCEDNITLQGLQILLAQSIPQLCSVNPETIEVSLNKKAALSGDGTALLTSLGICSGDQLWVLSSTGLPLQGNAMDTSPDTAAASQPSNTPQQCSKRSRTDGEASAAGPLTAETSTSNQAGTSTGISTSTTTETQQASTSAGDGSLQPSSHKPLLVTAMTSHSGDGKSSAAPDAEMQDVSTEETSTTATEDTEEHDQLLAKHIEEHAKAAQGPGRLLRAAMTWLEAMSGNTAMQQASYPARYPAHNLLLLCAHAAMEEAGFHLRPPPYADSNQATNTVPPHFPANGVVSMQYSYSGLESQQENQQPSAQPVCNLKASVMGPHLILHAAVSTVSSLSAQPGSGQGSAAPQNTMDVDGAQPSANSNTSTTTSAAAVVAARKPCTLTLDTRLELDLEFVKRVGSGSIAGETSQIQSSEPGAVFRQMRELWIKLQDQLAGCCVKNVCAAAGQDPPNGLMYLPRDLKDSLMRLMEAQDLAKLSCVCVELRYLASENVYWEPLFHKEFPNASSALRLAASQKGFKAAYAAAWKARKELAAKRLHLRNIPFPMFPHPLPDPRNPFLPVHPTYPPGIIGGDYDRFPSMPGIGMPRLPGFVPGGMYSAGGGLGLGGLARPGTQSMGPGSSNGGMFTAGGVPRGGQGTLGGRSGAARNYGLPF